MINLVYTHDFKYWIRSILHHLKLCAFYLYLESVPCSRTDILFNVQGHFIFVHLYIRCALPDICFTFSDISFVFWLCLSINLLFALQGLIWEHVVCNILDYTYSPHWWSKVIFILWNKIKLEVIMMMCIFCFCSLSFLVIFFFLFCILR